MKPEWFTDVYCHSCKEELGELIPESCEHAMVSCQFVRTARTTLFQNLNLAMTPIEPNLPEDSILWTPALGLNQPTSSLIYNAVQWLSSIELLKCKFNKITPNGVLISKNVKKILLKLSRKDKNNKVLREFEKLSTEVFHIQRPPED